MEYPQIDTANKVYQYGDYRIEEIKKGVYALDTCAFESLYLLVGEKKAVLIDTGMRKQNLMPVLRKLTNLPIVLLLTHGHSDHMYHADEFEEVWMHEADLKVWKKGLGLMAAVSSSFFCFMKRIYFKKFKKMKEGMRFNLGNRTLTVAEARGHTPGSVVFIDKEDKLIFTGDAIGSGSYAWMWMPFCDDVSAYKKSLEKLARTLFPYKDYTFLGGHRMQGYPSKDFPKASVLKYQVIIDMIELCQRLLDREIEETEIRKEFGIKVKRYEHKSAAVVYRDCKIK